jgi:crotonobetainyl-CoA:carnitine CoA-transferase CaiB-like acyl-CoA transferase
MLGQPVGGEVGRGGAVEDRPLDVGGEEGEREQAGYDLMIQAMGGLMSIIGQPDGSPGGGPVKVGVALVDVLTGLHAAIAILAALTERQATGKGQVIDLALFDVCAASLANQALNCLVSGRAPQRMGNQHPSIAPYQAYEASDGYMILAVGNDRQFQAFCAATGLADMPRDPRFATNSARVENREALNAVLEPALRSRSRADYIALLTPAGVPCGPINDIEEVFADPQAEARGLSTTLPHDALGSAPTVANPIRLDGTPVLADTAPPTLGAHTADVLSKVLGLSTEDVDRLTDARIIQR